METRYQNALDSNRFVLNFENQRIEEEFRYILHKRNTPKLRIQLMMGAVLVICTSAMDIFFMPVEFALVAAQLRGGFMLTIIFVALVLSYRGCSHYIMSLAGVGVGLSVGLGSLFIGFIAQKSGLPPVFSGYLVVTVYIYFFLGLRTWWAAITALTLLAVYVLAMLLLVQNPGKVVIYNGMFLLFLNVMCCVGSYSLEQVRRTAYLTEQILHLRATRDSMTKLSNRTVFDTALPTLWQQCIENKLRLTLLLIDIDHFKLFNDQYGHQKGDDAIVAVAKVLDGAAKRPHDLACRYGGEEFAILLSDAKYEYAQMQAQRVCDAVLALHIPHVASSTEKYLSVSVGLFSIWPHKLQHTQEGFVQTADEALYSAKQRGRNRCVLINADNDNAQESGEFNAEKWLAT